jgi:hypothetical protein
VRCCPTACFHPLFGFADKPRTHRPSQRGHAPQQSSERRSSTRSPI